MIGKKKIRDNIYRNDFLTPHSIELLFIQNFIERGVFILNELNGLSVLRLGIE